MFLSSGVILFLVHMGGTQRNHGTQRKASLKACKGPIVEEVTAMKGGTEDYACMSG